MHPTARPAVLLAAIIAGGNSFAVPFTIEGPLTAISSSGLTCNGVQVVTDAATVYSTPTGVVSQAKLLSTTPFPGNPLNSPAGQSAFIGGTCIVEGEDLPTTGRLASTVFVEIRENVLLGPTTSQSPFSIMGVQIVLLTTQNEPVGRILAGPPVNAQGFEVDLATVPLNDESSAEGYMGSDGKFYAHAVETSAGDPKVKPTQPESRISRAQSDTVNATTVKLEVRGSCSWLTPPTGAARTQPVLVNLDNGVGTDSNPIWVNPTTRAESTPASNQSNVTCTEDLATPGFGNFRYRLDRYTFTRAAPSLARARVASPSSATAAYPWSPTFTMTVR